jgi:hypothetical protein
MSVKQVLKSYVSGLQMGEGTLAMTPRHELTADLAAVSRTNLLYFQVCFGALLLLFTGSCALVVRFMNDPGSLGTLFAVTGISVVGLVAQMVALWKQKVTADVVALLARNLQAADVRGVIEVLFAKL